jgi:hypothetical protein
VQSDASPNGVRSSLVFFYAIFFQSVNGKACGSKVDEIIFYWKYNEQRNAVAAATVSV